MKMNVKELGCKEVHWIDLAHDSDQWFTFVNMASNMCFQVLLAFVGHVVFTLPSEVLLPYFGEICCFHLQGG